MRLGSGPHSKVNTVRYGSGSDRLMISEYFKRETQRGLKLSNHTVILLECGRYRSRTVPSDNSPGGLRNNNRQSEIGNRQCGERGIKLEAHLDCPP